MTSTKKKHKSNNIWVWLLAVCIGISAIFSGREEAPTFTSTSEQSVNSYFEVHYIDVGQADAALVICDGRYMLIDGGNTADSALLYTYLKNLEITYLDYIVASHAHEDHVGGLAGALNYTDVGTVYCPVTSYDSEPFRDFLKYVEAKDAAITVPEAGDTFSLGSASVEILGLNAGREENDTSMIVKITYKDTSFLFTGDAEREAEQAVLDNGCDLSSTVLKVGHHGGGDSTTYPFLREVMPAYAVISVGADNSYGHPADSTLSRLRDAGAEIYRTDIQGTIIAVSDGKEVTITTEKHGEASQGAKYILNTNSRKFHLSSCSSVEKIAGHNYAEFTGTAEELEAMGYVGCKQCKP